MAAEHHREVGAQEPRRLLLDPVAQAVELEQHVRVERLDVLARQLARRPGACDAPLLGVLAREVRRRDEGAPLVGSVGARLGAREAHGEGVEIGADRASAPRSWPRRARCRSRRTGSSTAPSEGRERLDEAARGVGVHARGVGVEAVDVGAVLAFGGDGSGRRGGVDFERLGEGLGLGAAAAEVDRAADVREGAAVGAGRSGRTSLTPGPSPGGRGVVTSRGSGSPPAADGGGARRGSRHGRTMFVPGGGVKVKVPGSIASLTCGLSNVNLLRLP